jgi:hypothetical protein
MPSAESIRRVESALNEVDSLWGELAAEEKEAARAGDAARAARLAEVVGMLRVVGEELAGIRDVIRRAKL